MAVIAAAPATRTTRLGPSTLQVAHRSLLRYLRTRTLTPFGVYCLIAGIASVVYLGLVK